MRSTIPYGMLLIAFLAGTCKKSDPVTSTPFQSTPDTTSHNFVWQIDTIGAEDSFLKDVFIIDDSTAYAVGQILPRDSLGQSDYSNSQCLCRWDGKKWIPIKLSYINGGHKGVLVDLSGIWVLGSNDIWLASGSVFHWDGRSALADLVLSRLTLPDPATMINKIWAGSSSMVYGVGSPSSIVYFNGSSWQSLQSGTTLPFHDIWGVLSTNGQYHVIAVGSDTYGLGGRYLARLVGNSVVHLDDNISTATSLSSIWFVPNKQYYLVGDGIYKKHSLSDSTWESDPFMAELYNYPYVVRGASTSDVVVVGDAGVIAHFNGAGWKKYDNIVHSTDRLLGVSIKNNQIIAVGFRYIDGIRNYGVIYHGRR